MGEPTHAHPIHQALKVVRQTRLDGGRKALSNRLTCQLLVSSIKISLQLCHLGLQVSNNLVGVNWLWLQHGCSICSIIAKGGYREYTHNTQRYQRNGRSKTTPKTICEVSMSLYTKDTAKIV